MEKEILNAFLYNEKLKFNEIGKHLDTRSNKLSYHIKKLIEKGVLEKSGDYYSLSEKSEHIIPYISEKKSALPVILACIKNSKDEIFLVKRKKRPFKEMLGLPGGRLLMNESIKRATERIMKEKFNIKCKLKEINSISLEHVKKKKRTIHSFLLIFVTAVTNQKISYTSLYKNKSIISSDYNLIKNSEKRTLIDELITSV